MTLTTPAPGYARPPKPPGRNLNGTLLAVGFALVGICGLLTAGAVLFTTGPVAFVIGLAFAVPPVVVLLLYFRWLDRNEPEPAALLVFGFGWGAAVATFARLILNSTSVLVLDAAGTDPEFGSIVVVAPIVEEAFKGLGLLAILLVGRRALDGVVDGIVYAGVIGAGFAFVENILYLGEALLEGGTAGLVVTFVLRGIFSPFAHPLFAAAMGIAIALAARRGGPRWGLVVLGYIVSVLLHALWNFSAVSAFGTFVAVFVLLQVPIFILYVSVAIWARNRENRLVREHLPPYAAAGWFAPAEVAMLADPAARRATVRRAKAVADGGRTASADREYQRSAVQLSFLRHRMVRGSAPRDAAMREWNLLNVIHSERGRIARSA